jgi:hypothetical protein
MTLALRKSSQLVAIDAIAPRAKANDDTSAVPSEATHALFCYWPANRVTDNIDAALPCFSLNGL